MRFKVGRELHIYYELLFFKNIKYCFQPSRLNNLQKTLKYYKLEILLIEKLAIKILR